MEWGFANFARPTILKEGAEVGRAIVQNGEKQSVRLVAQEDLTVAVPRNAESKPAFFVSYDGPLEAPIVAGEEVAFLEMRIGGKLTARLPLVAAEEIAKAGFVTRITNAVKGWAG